MLPRRSVAYLLLVSGALSATSFAVAGEYAFRDQASAQSAACASCATSGQSLTAGLAAPALPAASSRAAPLNAPSTLPVASAEPATAATESPATAAVRAGLVRPGPLADVFGASTAVRSLEQGLSPYLAVSAARTGGLLEAVSIPADAAGGTPRPEFRLGEDMIVMPVKGYTERVLVALPAGVWINYWTGAQAMGGGTVAVEVPGGSYPMWARGGAVIPRRTGGYDGTGFLEKRLTADGTNCGASCLYDVMPAFNDATTLTEKDADGRTLTRGANSLRICGTATHAIVRWRFQRVTDVYLNGKKVPVQMSPDGYYASFDHAADSTVEWTVLSYMPRSY